MKKIKFLFSVFSVSVISLISYTPANAEGNWTKKANVGGVERYEAVGFSIGSKGYIGTGSTNPDVSNMKFDTKPSQLLKDFWEYDPAKDTWTQKADFGGTARERAIGFAIGNKGYIGTGWDHVAKGKIASDFWEYDPAANKWAKKADFEGRHRFDALGFSIGNKGYVGLSAGTDFWEYDPANDKWTKKSGLPVFALQVEFVGFIGFGIDNKGYIGLGCKRKWLSSSPNGDNYNDVLLDNMYEYDPASDKWTKKADFPGGKRYQAVCFAIGNKGYVTTGENKDLIRKGDLWEYDPATDKWTQKADAPEIARTRAVGFSIGNKGYIGTGRTDAKGPENDFWEWSE
jgi:N-acetylneuraminic acid mutarotase